LSQEFGWSRGEISFAMTLTNLAVTPISPLLGHLADRYGSRAVLVLAHLSLGLALGSFYFLSAPLWHFYALYLCIGLLGAGTSPLSGSTRPEALRTRAFWQMVAVFSSAATCSYAAVAHLVPSLTDRGMPVQQAAFALRRGTRGIRPPSRNRRDAVSRQPLL